MGNLPFSFLLFIFFSLLVLASLFFFLKLFPVEGSNLISDLRSDLSFSILVLAFFSILIYRINTGVGSFRYLWDIFKILVTGT